MCCCGSLCLFYSNVSAIDQAVQVTDVSVAVRVEDPIKFLKVRGRERIVEGRRLENKIDRYRQV